MFYNSSRCTNPYLEGVSFAVFKEGKEIYGEFKTISLGFNNIGEFTNCLKECNVSNQ